MNFWPVFFQVNSHTRHPVIVFGTKIDDVVVCISITPLEVDAMHPSRAVAHHDAIPKHSNVVLEVEED